jgi:hypothetical protein
MCVNISLGKCEHIVTYVRFPWLWRYHCYNNAIVQCRVSLVTQQYLAYNNVNKQNSYECNNGRALLWIWRGDIKGTWNELVSGVRERVEVGRYSER